MVLGSTASLDQGGQPTLPRRRPADALPQQKMVVLPMHFQNWRPAVTHAQLEGRFVSSRAVYAVRGLPFVRLILSDSRTMIPHRFCSSSPYSFTQHAPRASRPPLLYLVLPILI